MKKNLKSLIASSAGSFMKKAALTIGVSLFAIAGVDAQCLTNNLDIRTGMGYGPTMLINGIQDPFWKITDKTTIFLPFSPPIGANAETVPPLIGWGSLPAAWICDNQDHATLSNGAYADAEDYMTFGREFTLCEDGEIRFTLKILVDNYIKKITVDGVVVPGTPSQPYGNHSATIWNVPVFTIPLTSGTHLLEIEVWENNDPARNPIGLSVEGYLTSASAILVDPTQAGCRDYVCPQSAPCSDKCYWKVEGNNILNGNNIFGTLTDHDVRVVTNKGTAGIPDRGVIKGGNATTGGFLGWNTTVPSARLHVNCKNGNNPESLPGIPSDIRFEDLEPGEGTILVIDKDGYVYNSHVPVGQESPVAPEVMNMKEEIRELKMQLTELCQTLATGSVDKYNAQVQNELYQNNPNPFGKETSIGYNIVNMLQGAFIAVYDLNGKEIFRQAVTEKGKGSITLSGDKLVPGMYLYSLIIDGKETATKRMVVTK
ncbi:MAG TPA: T9SS type A sorting domain-containing protein [Flavipsychrobacter sp.]|nr:T9SS type A sorting domain-containing protein [Flavipsychrobacter sp.]